LGWCTKTRVYKKIMMIKNNKPNPPKIASWILYRISKPEDRFGVMGDFEEIHSEKASKYGNLRAWFWYWRQIFRSLPLFTKNYVYWSTTMLKSYIKIALRNIKREKIYSAINISGLSLGFASCLLIMLYISDEISYDKHYQYADRIYRVVENIDVNGSMLELAITPGPWAPAFKAEIPLIEEFTRIALLGDLVITARDKNFYENRFFLADPYILEMFDIRLSAGDVNNALSVQNTIIITGEIAQKYFGDLNPIGQVITVDETNLFTVTGVLDDRDVKSHFDFDFLASLSSISNIRNRNNEIVDVLSESNWRAFNFYSYLLLADEKDTKEVEMQMIDVLKRNINEGITDEPYLQPVKNIHLYSKIGADFAVNGDIKYIYIFAVSALLILLIAVINFISLSTARAVKRSKEVGIRKVVGAERSQLIKQFIGESIGFSGIALVLSLLIVTAVMPLFNSLAEKNFSLNVLINSNLIMLFIAFSILLGIVSGSYPAFILSSFKPVNVLKSKFSGSTSLFSFRKIIVVAQFSITIIILIAMGVVHSQLKFLNEIDLGFDKEHVLVLRAQEDITPSAVSSMKTAFNRLPSVINNTFSTSVPGYGGRAATFRTQDDPERGNFVWAINEIDFDYFKTLGVEMVEGRDFSKEYSTDPTSAIIINEEAKTVLGWDIAMGKIVTTENGKTGPIIGVVKNYNFKSLHSKIEPIVLHISSRRIRKISLRITSDNIPGTIENVRAVWKETLPDVPFDYTFLDENFAGLYKSEKRLSDIFSVFSSMGMFLACLGLFGLSSFASEQRTREIGIRKVLGASVKSILVLLIRDFSKWIVVAAFISAPIAYYISQKWLEGFAYRIDLSVLLFFGAGFVTLAIAVITITAQSIKAAISNPVDTLKYE